MSQQEIWDSVQEWSCPAHLSIRTGKSWATTAFQARGQCFVAPALWSVYLAPSFRTLRSSFFRGKLAQLCEFFSKLCPRPVLLKLQSISQSPRKLIETHTTGPYPGVSDSVGVGKAGQFELLMGSQVMLMVLVWGLHVENRYHCHRPKLSLIDLVKCSK